MPVEHAARIEDEIAHGFGLAAMVAGAVVGALAGAAVVAATAATGGLAAVVIAGAVAGGGLAGGQIMSGLNTIFDLPEPTTGVLAIGSPDVAVNKRAAIRAELSSASSCSGLPFNHPWWPASVAVQEGSATVRINGRPASRLKSKLMCGAHIKTASPDVRIGGETERTGFVFDLEAWTKTGLEILGLAALVGAGVLAVAAGVAATAAFVGIGAAGYAGMDGVGRIGDALGPGYRDLLQGVVGMGLVVAGPKLARTAQAARGLNLDTRPPGKPFEGPVHRLENPARLSSTFDAHPGNVAANHRYSGPGKGAVYGGTSPETALAEINHYGAASGRVAASKDIKLNNVLDLTDPATRRQLNIGTDDISGDSYDVTHRIGDWARTSGYDGILAPSARNPGGSNIVIFPKD